jgi:hypothetical protein
VVSTLRAKAAGAEAGRHLQDVRMEATTAGEDSHKETSKEEMKPATRDRIRRVKSRFDELKRAAAIAGRRAKRCDLYELIGEEEHLAPDTIKQIVVNRHYSQTRSARSL